MIISSMMHNRWIDAREVSQLVDMIATNLAGINCQSQLPVGILMRSCQDFNVSELISKNQQKLHEWEDILWRQVTTILIAFLSII